MEFTNLDDIGWYFRNQREKRGMSQKQLAECIGTQQPSIAKFESGEWLPRLSFLKCIAEALGITIAIGVNSSLKKI